VSLDKRTKFARSDTPDFEGDIGVTTSNFVGCSMDKSAGCMRYYIMSPMRGYLAQLFRVEAEPAGVLRVLKVGDVLLQLGLLEPKTDKSILQGRIVRLRCPGHDKGPEGGKLWPRRRHALYQPAATSP
jgi:hypothetical protein